MSYTDWSIVSAYLKATQAHAVITPHQRSKGQRIHLMVLAVLKSASTRLDVKLCNVKSEVRFSFKQHEAIAFLSAYEYGYLPPVLPIQEIVTVIDKAI